MKIVAISDTHEKHEQIVLPVGDVLIHCGDSTNRGSIDKFKEFATWMSNQSFKHKVLIFGNHEIGFSKNPKRDDALNICKELGLILLQDSGAEIDGIKFFGQPWQPWYHNWEFNVPRGEEIAEKWKLIPNDVNVLITHGPPKNILDLVDNTWGDYHKGHEGCEDLLNRIENLSDLKLHAFGHLHFQGGNQTTIENKIFANAAICDDYHNPIHAPLEIEI